MGSGKSTVGRQLAGQLGYSFYDTDELVEKQVGSSISAIINSQGESAFRLIEKKAIKLVSLMDRAVISTGGGVPLDEENMRDLSKDSVVVWLKVSPKTVLSRIKNLASRPLINPENPESSIEVRLKDREKFYAKASYSVETDGLSKDQVVEKIKGHLAPLLK